MIFNIVVYAVVWEVLDIVCSLQEAQHSMRWAYGEIKIVLYVDDGSIEGRDHEWVQDVLTVTVAIFRRVGLGSNLDKTKAVIFTPSFIWGEWRETAYK